MDLDRYVNQDNQMSQENNSYHFDRIFLRYSNEGFNPMNYIDDSYLPDRHILSKSTLLDKIIRFIYRIKNRVYHASKC